jgi:hypothetical protein
MIIICGKAGRVTAESLLGVERKTVSNFSEFLQGKGTRCPHCLHKAKNHDDGGEGGCQARRGTCDCVANRLWIKRWWAKRTVTQVMHKADRGGTIRCGARYSNLLSTPDWHNINCKRCLKLRDP